MKRALSFALYGTVLLCCSLALWGVFVLRDSAPQDATDVRPARGVEGSLVVNGTESGSDEGEELPPPVPSPPGALWAHVALDSVAPQVVLPYMEIVEEVDDRALVRMAESPWPLAVGDDLVVTIPQLGEIYRPVVDRVMTGPGSSRSVAGTVKAQDGQPRIFVYTVGPRSAFAYIDTPHGSYELVANRDLGWLMPSANMNQHVDYTQPDTFPVTRGRLARPSDASL